MNVSTIYRQALGPDIEPYRWQATLAIDAWPQILVAPTGTGKTAAVTLGWAAHRLRSPADTPRRLVWCLPMRTLVAQTTTAAREWFGKLATLDDANRLPRPEDVHLLMGGENSDRWLRTPERPAVLVGTQDMLLSWALMRGYASSRALWPMGFALLHEDAQWVFDEVQLMGAGRATSAQLEAFRRAEAERATRTGIPQGRPSRSLWTSATLSPCWLKTVDHPAPASVAKIDPRAEGGRLACLANARKRLHRWQAGPASSKKGDVESYLDRLAESILGAHQPRQMTLVIVNRVDRAQALHRILRKKSANQLEMDPTLALLHSRFRPADRKREMEKVTEDTNPHGRIVVATQAIEAGVDISAAVMFTEVAPWSSMIQRFGRANRYAEHSDGAEVHWIDLLQASRDGTESEKDAVSLALPYSPDQLRSAREQLTKLPDVAPANLPEADDIEPSLRIIRRQDLDVLFDTDPDLTGCDVDVSAYVRDIDDTDIRLFWRDLSAPCEDRLRPERKELCAVSIRVAREWIREIRKISGDRNLLFRRDPQWRRKDGVLTATPGWIPFRDDPWPGLVLLADCKAGGYLESIGFTGNPKNLPQPVGRTKSARTLDVPSETEQHNDDPLSQDSPPVALVAHIRHVTEEATTLCRNLGLDPDTGHAVIRAACWHDVGKAHDVFQETMRRGIQNADVLDDLLAKTEGRFHHSRPYFRHELASALAFLAHEGWSRDADLIAYLIAAHHGKVRLNLRPLPREVAPAGDRSGIRFARGIWEGDKLPPVELAGAEHWAGGPLRLSVMDLGWDEVTHESWTERTRQLLARFGPFRLAWLETILRVADWRASAKERSEGYDVR